MKSALYLITVNGGKWQCEGMSKLRLQLCNGATADVSVCMTTQMPLSFSLILGMDGIRALGGVTVDPQGSVCFGIEDEICAAADLELKVDEPDFTAFYDLRRNCWTAA